MINFKTIKSLKEYDAVTLSERLRADFVREYPARTVEALTDAIHVASYLHRNDVRRGARGNSVKPPYIEHPLRVALRAADNFAVDNPSVIIAAVLHDTVEDHAFDFSDFEGVNVEENEYRARASALRYIAMKFGADVADIVLRVSNPLIEKGTPKAEKVEAYHEHIRERAVTDSRSLIIKVSDFVDNAGSLHHHYPLGSKDVTYFLDRYEPLIDLYRQALLSGNHDYNSNAAVRRLNDVENQFDQFRQSLA